MNRSILFIVLGAILLLLFGVKYTKSASSTNYFNDSLQDSTIYFIDTFEAKGLLLSFKGKRKVTTKAINVFIENINLNDLDLYKRKSFSDLLINGNIYLTNSDFLMLLFRSDFNKYRYYMHYKDSFEKDHKLLQTKIRSINGRFDVYSLNSEFLAILINTNFLRKFNNFFVNEKVLPKYGYVKIITPNYFFKLKGY